MRMQSWGMMVCLTNANETPIYESQTFKEDPMLHDLKQRNF